MTDGAWDELHPHTITVRTATPGFPDASGVPTGTTTETIAPGWNVQPLSSADTVADVETVTARWRASGPLSTWIPATAHVLWQGREYSIDGEPAHYTGGALDHTELILIAWR